MGVLYDDVSGLPDSYWQGDSQSGDVELWWNGRHLGYVSNPASSPAIVWSGTNWIGSDRLRTDSSGNLIGAFDSLPFGDGLSTYLGTDNDLTHFTGKERDVNTSDVNNQSGLDYFRARFYSSTMGRFLNPDFSSASVQNEPLPFSDLPNPQSLNLYSYALNNPTSLIDSDGHDPNKAGSPGASGSNPSTTSCDPHLPCFRVNAFGFSYGNSWGGSFGGRPFFNSPQHSSNSSAPNNGRNCTPSPASSGQYAMSATTVAALADQFFTGLGPQNVTFGADSAMSAVIAQSAGV